MINEPTVQAPGHRSLADIFEDLRIARARVTTAQKMLNYQVVRESDLKDELRLAMEADGIRTGEGSGLQAQLKSRKSIAVTDIAALTAALQQEGRLDDFLVLDKTSAAKESVKHGWDGAEVTTTTYLAVKEVAS